MTELQIEEFKKKASNYRFNLKLLEHLDERIDVTFYQMTGVSAVKFDTIRVNVSEQQKADRYHKLSERLESLMNDRDVILEHINYVDKIIGKMNEYDSNIFKLKYHDGLTFEAIGKMCYLSKSGVVYQFEKVLKELNIDEE